MDKKRNNPHLKTYQNIQIKYIWESIYWAISINCHGNKPAEKKK